MSVAVSKISNKIFTLLVSFLERIITVAFEASCLEGFAYIVWPLLTLAHTHLCYFRGSSAPTAHTLRRCELCYIMSY
jgi:hypothetical protein